MRSDCPRCNKWLKEWSEPTDCEMPDPLCPIWGYADHLFKGDEEQARKAFNDIKEAQE